MQIFLPYLTYDMCARVLDRQRLGKQRVECKQIMMAIDGETKAWANHPVVKMWKPYPQSLLRYAIAACDEWIARGYRDNLRKWFRARQKRELILSPEWLTMHLASQYRGLLLYKDPEWYGQFGWRDHPIEKIRYPIVE